MQPTEEEEVAKLKARATELGINFAANIGLTALRARVEVAERKLEGNGG